ncbi:MAG TPA: 1,4-dihydroxy-2-naphthoate octaprenyltransferase, partial [Acidimicrobiales bacterium]|nr:1,4-dihydroxy-2-naphthoate octaprenyltransferase [Acidimicrobiales bacterium]
MPAALVPVAVGASVAYSRTHLRVGVAGRVPIVGAVAHHGKALLVSMPEVSWAAVVLALVVAISMQVGVNLANDYSDGVRGTDKERVGPPRMVGSGMAKPRSVKIAAIGAFGIGAAAGLAVAIMVAPWLIVVGAVCILAGWLYTGGSHPYGYRGLGELAVFVFFGVVATSGTTFVATGHLYLMAVVASISVGLLSVALLVTNNLRDI